MPRPVLLAMYSFGAAGLIVKFCQWFADGWYAFGVGVVLCVAAGYLSEAVLPSRKDPVIPRKESHLS